MKRFGILLAIAALALRSWRVPGFGTLRVSRRRLAPLRLASLASC